MEYIPFIVIGIVIVAIVAYLHTSAGKAAEAKLTAAVDSLKTHVSTEVASVKASVTAVESKVGLVHAATLAPVQVVSAPTPAAPAAPAAPANTTITISGAPSTLSPLVASMLGSGAVANAGQVLDARVAAAPAPTTVAWDGVAFGKAQGYHYGASLAPGQTDNLQFSAVPGQFMLTLQNNDNVTASVVGLSAPVGYGYAFTVSEQMQLTCSVTLLDPSKPGRYDVALSKVA